MLVSRPTRWGVIDLMETDPSGLIRLVGWSQTAIDRDHAPRLTLNGHPVPFLYAYRFHRPDVAPEETALLKQSGIVFEYLVDHSQCGAQQNDMVIDIGEGEPSVIPGAFTFHAPHYRGLFMTEQVMGRDNIYSVGPPSPIAHPEVLEICQTLQGRVLDFGCGTGALVEAMREKGVDAHGLELDRGPIHEGLNPKARPYVTLYDGTFPSPYPDGTFDCVVSAEVVEHIPDPEAAIAEIARLTRSKAVITVPDASVIPLGTHYGLIPWHLLEASHLSFFNQNSLNRVLSRHFRNVEFGRMTPCQMNGSRFHVSLLAIATK